MSAKGVMSPGPPETRGIILAIMQHIERYKLNKLTTEISNARLHMGSMRLGWEWRVGNDTVSERSLHTDDALPIIWFRAVSSAGERSLHTREVVGSIPTPPTSSLPFTRERS